MKKLNKKGFTLIELLAVIVILAVVMVVTIPSVLNSMGSARQEQFKNAVLSIQEYVQKNYDLCVTAQSSTIIGSSDYDSTIFGTNNCTPDNTKVIAGAGYSTTDIDSVTGSITNGKYKITNATAGSNGKFKGVIAYSAS